MRDNAKEITIAALLSPQARPARYRIRALVIADRRPEFGGRVLKDVVAERGIDLIVTAGDLYASDLSGIDALDVPSLGVYGNHCDGRYFNKLGITNLHLARVEIAGTTFTGLQGCVRYKEGTRDLLYTQDEYAEMISQMPAADVLVTHCPPAGINDHADAAHVGITALRTWVDANSPRVLIHGHTYPDVPAITYGRTRIEYVYGARIVEL